MRGVMEGTTDLLAYHGCSPFWKNVSRHPLNLPRILAGPSWPTTDGSLYLKECCKPVYRATIVVMRQ